MKKRSILIAVDGSKGGMAAVRYVAETAHPEGLTIHLFSVMSPMPESFCDSEMEPGDLHEEEIAARWETEQERITEGFLKESKQVLTASGIEPEHVTYKLHRRERGIAKDIAMEAQRGYDAVVLGRRGNNPASELPIGSVATKIANTLHHFPVWIVAGPAERSKVLVAMDCSKSALRALDHACDMLHPDCPGICLCHVIREAVGQAPEPSSGHSDEAGRFLAEMNRKRMEKAETTMGRCFMGGVGQLKSRGFDSGRVATRIITGAASRAGSVVREAKTNGYGTIILGRQGLNPEEGFFMGQVCSKVLQLATDITVWIVS
jgi:nucleotide-binding universal stress UspA family protein